ncbi:hypothetical protein [Streptomyces sp. NPDC059708]|uniref:hypothetical protein n=1 Tax=Streptomyces sp. NPDC059708 TaxID=3346916 RepID=UPI0036AF6112
MASEGRAGGVVQHGSTYAAPGEKCVCRGFDCGGVDPVAWCREHGTQAGPVMEWHPGGGLRCTALAGRRAEVAVRR